MNYVERIILHQHRSRKRNLIPRGFELCVEFTWNQAGPDKHVSNFETNPWLPLLNYIRRAIIVSQLLICMILSQNLFRDKYDGCCGR